MAAYNYTTPLIVMHGQVGEVETNFPVLVQTSSVLFSTSSSGGHMLTAYDLVFSTMPNCSFLLNWDTETVNNTGSAQANIWVEVPILSSTTDTVFYMCYGNAGITSYQGNSALTWDSNFAGVWHLGDGSALNTLDSTVNGNTGTNTAATAATGQVDGAAAFLATNSAQIDVGTAINNVVGPLTVEFWEFIPSVSVSNEAYIGNDDGNANGYSFYAIKSGTQYRVRWEIESGSPFVNATPLINPGSWVSIVGTYDNINTLLTYNNGTQFGTSTGAGSGAITVPVQDMLFGGVVGFGAIAPLTGSLDEVRISSVARSGGWLRTTYNTESSPSTFLIFDTEVNNATAFENEKGIVFDGGKMTLNGGRVTVQ